MKAKAWMEVARRRAVAASEVRRRAYLYVARNEELPSAIRQRASMLLHSRKLFPSVTLPTQVRKRCVDTGHGRGILNVDHYALNRMNFKERVKAGQLRGWENASW